tara:strand:- start:72 stop:305 length:234 start_codon:yes stop_codon:yes gene_type:complete
MGGSFLLLEPMTKATDIRERFLRMPEIVQTTGLCKATIYNKINDGSFPKQIPIGSNIVVWLESEIKEWMDNQIKMSR